MSTNYVIADLIRNPRRTLSTTVGVVLGVGLFCAVLFFIDGLSASMTQRAVEPLAIDMQRIVTQRAGGTIELTQTVESTLSEPGGHRRITIELHNPGSAAANEVTLRSVVTAPARYVAGSARIDGATVADAVENPFARGAARVGYNLGTVEGGITRSISFLVSGGSVNDLDDAAIRTTSSTREAIKPIVANQSPNVALRTLAADIAGVAGVARAKPLSVADLGTDRLHAGSQTARGPTKIFGLDGSYAEADDTITMVEGVLADDGAVVSAEAAAALGVRLGDSVQIDLPDDTQIERRVTGIADLTRARSLFSSRRGGDLETFVYSSMSVIVSAREFEQTVFPAYDRAAARSDDRLKSPPIREVDIMLAREVLDADPAQAVAQTEQIGADISAIAAHQDYLLDNISNTLHVAAGDAQVAKRLFVFLGVPGALLAAMLAAYAGNVLAEAQRREHATLRIRGASRRRLLRMLAARTALLTASASIGGLVIGYASAAAVLGRASLERASTAGLATSAAIGTTVGFVATGAALYLTGRRAIEREINDDRARLADRAPLWRRLGLDAIAGTVAVVGTIWALRTGAFDGTAGSVYFGRSVRLNLALLVLPIAVWLAGSLVASRVLGGTLRRTGPASAPRLGNATSALFRRSIGRRPWAIGNAAIIAALVVGLATSMVTFTASYDQAKAADARFANGADIRITLSPTAARVLGADDVAVFDSPMIEMVTPVISGLSNVILRSDRTSDPANLVALDPVSYEQVAPIDAATAADIRKLSSDSSGILVSREMAEFLHVDSGDHLDVLLARATPSQTEIAVTIIGLFDRLPGFPEGADAVLDIAQHTAAVPGKAPDFFLAATVDDSDGTLERAVDELVSDAATMGGIHIDTRTSTLDRDQSSLAALNIAGLVRLDSTFALAMAVVAVGIFVFGLLLQRRREYVMLRAQGMDARTVRLLIGAEATTASLAGTVAGLVIGVAMGYYFVTVLRPLFVLDPTYVVPINALATPALLVVVAAFTTALAASRIVNRLDPTELLRDD